MHNIKLFESTDHLFVFLNENKSSPEHGIHSNQYLIKHHDHAVLLDPGGFNVMPNVLSEMLRYITIDKLSAIILSHQDPDVLGGVVSWLALSSASVYIPEIWLRFVPHLGITTDIHRFHPVPDHGMEYLMGQDCKLQLIPAHFLHSEGNISVYDPLSKILFSGDIGAAGSVLGDNPFVDNFADHVPHIENFHKRYMCSNRAIQVWLQKISKLDIEMIAPQHGRIYKGQALQQFIEWLGNLKCGIDLFDADGFINMETKT